jgi:hypothetical protein
MNRGDIRMKLTQILSISLAALFCISGQSPRKEIAPLQAIAEVKVEKKAVKKAEQPKKSAAKRSMEAVLNGASVERKGAAKKALEI